jgi:transcriptional regulator with XRE-family HTH domain
MDAISRQNLTSNIQRLVRARGNITYICDRIGINRQQFNKYLAGQHVPSQFNLNLICKYFDVSFAEIISSDMKIPENQHPSEYLFGFRAFENSKILQEMMISNDKARLLGFVGTYFKYHHSSIYKGQIVRAITVIKPFGELFAYANLERFPNQGGAPRHDYVFKYRGFVFCLEDRLFLTDFEAVQKNELTFSIYTPIVRNPTRFMFGVTSGIAANLYREPYVSKSVLDFRSREKPTRDMMRQTTVIDINDPSLPQEARDYLKS